MDLETQLKAILGDNYPRDGITNLNAPHGVTPNTAKVLYDFVRAVKPARTLEVGMAYGISTLCICQAHQDNGAGAGCHIVIDPYQEESFKGAGLANLERASLKDMLRFYQARSDEVLRGALRTGRADRLRLHRREAPLRLRSGRFLFHRQD